MCFELAPAPAVFQKMMSQELKGCSRVLCYLNDILVWGKDRGEHDMNLKTVLNGIDAFGIKLHHKWVFSVNEVHYLAHRSWVIAT